MLTCGGVCGHVYIRGAELPPPDKKLQRAVVPKGAIKIRAAEAPGLRTRARRKWVALERDDLRKIASTEVPKLWRGRAVGPVVAGAIPMISASTTYNQAKALICRMFAGPDPPEVGIWTWAAAFKKIIFPEYDFPPASWTDEQWLESLPADRRKILEGALVLWRGSAWTSKYELFHSFVKEELLPFFSKDGLDLVPLRAMVDRLINAPHDVTHVIAGPKIKPFMSWLKGQWRWDTHLFYGGVAPEYLQQWLQRATTQGERLVFWSDYTMFDSSHNADTWEFVEDFYRMYKDDPNFQRVLKAWRCPKGSIGHLKYQGRVMNASGRDDTALANAILNGVAMLLSVTAAWLGKPLREIGAGDLEQISSELLLSVCGDDALGFLPPCTPSVADEFITRCRGHLKAFGFMAKMFWSNRFEDAVYLGHRPLPVNGVWYWAKTVGRCIYKLGWQCRVRGDPQAHMAGIMKMHEICSGHVPILGDLAKEWLKSVKGSKVNHWSPDPNKPWEEMGRVAPSCYADDTIAALARAYTVTADRGRGDLRDGGVHDVLVTPEDVRGCVKYVTEVLHFAGGRPCVLDHWLLRHMVVVDEE